jgi:hypothetical protein
MRRLQPQHQSWLLGLIILAYTCFSTGVLSWLPAVLYASQHHHDVTVQYQDDQVKWSMLHHGSIADHADVLSAQVEQTVDHQFSTPDLQDDQQIGKLLLAILPVAVALLILATFLALLRYQQIRSIHLPHMTVPLRLWIHNLRRTAVLRH